MRRYSLIFVLIVFSTFGLVASSCGSGADGADVVVGDAEASGDGSGGSLDAAAQLAQALDSTAEVTHYGMSSAIGIRFDVPAAGLSQSVPLDLDSAVMTMIIDGDRQYMHMDMSDLIEAFAGQAGDVGSLTMEMWVDADQMIIDTRGFGDGASYPGDPFAPGVSSVDLGEVERRGGNLYSALGATSLSLEALTESFLGMADLEVSDDGRTFTGRAGFIEVMNAQEGADIEQMMRGMSDAFSQGSDIDGDDMVEFILDVFEAIEVDVTLQLDDDFLLEEMIMDIDMTPMFGAIVEFANAGDYGLSEADIADMEREMEGARIEMEMGSRIDLDPGEIPPEPEATEDRTQEWLDMLGLMGMLDA